MALRVVVVNLPILFAGNSFMGAVAKRLIFREPTHANPNRFRLRFDFERLVRAF